MSSPQPSNPSRAANDRGSAVVEFVLVGALLALLAAGLFQLALTLHMRNILLSAASEGAHVAALADRSPGQGAARASDLATESLGGRDVFVTVDESVVDGADVVALTLSTPVPILGLWGAGSISVTAHALEES